MIRTASIILLLTTYLTQALDTCTSNPTLSTLYDSYLDTEIYYASFSRTQNSYFTIPNPFYGLTLSTMSVVFWAKIPQISADGTFQTGTFVDCSDSGQVRLSNDSLTFGIANSSSQTNASTLGTIFRSQFSLIQQWNNYAVIFSGKVLYIYLNGVSQSSKTSTFSSLVTVPSQCTIGNSQQLGDPINAYIRHLLFSKAAINSGSTIQTIIHHITLPTDPNALAYYQFSSSFNSEQTYTHSVSAATSFTSSNVVISSDPEAEFVCYCTGTYPNYMQMNGNQQLNPFVLKSTSVTNLGVFIDFTVFLSEPQSSQTSDVLIFSLTNYTDIYLSQSLSIFRVDVYNSKGATTTMYLTTYALRYNFWTQYTFSITPTSIILYVDGTLYYKGTLSLTLQNSVSNFTLPSPTGFTYMISSLAVRNSKNVSALTANFTENAMNASYISSIIQSGTISFGQSNAFCPMSNANQTIYWNGYSCIDNRLTPYFQGGSNSSLTTGSLLQASLYSSKATMTIELWIRDMNTLSQTRQVLFENTQDGGVTSLVQISITTGASTSASRSITCSPSITAQPQEDITLGSQSTYNQWTHFSCISNAANQSLATILFNPTLVKTSYAYSSGATFVDSSATLQTSLGSNILGSSLTKFQGYLKQLRIWDTARSAYQVQVFRYQILSSTTPDLLHYFMLNDQFNPFDLQGFGADQATIVEQAFTPDISYLPDKDLAICQLGFYYNGQCCQIFNIQTANFTIVYNVSANLIQVAFNPSTLLNSYLNTSIKVNFSLLSVGNNYAYNYLGDSIDIYTYLSTFFNQNGVQSFSVSANLVDPSVYSLTIQAVIYSDYDITQSTTLNQTFVLTCPNVWLSILPGQVITNYTQIVSEASLDTTPTITATLASTCYTMGSNGVLTQQAYASTSIAWGWNISAYAFTNIYTIASDSLSITVASTKAKALLINSNSYQLITMNYTYGSKKVSTTIKVYYSPTLKIINSQSLALSSTVDMVQGMSTSSISLDLSSFTSSNSSYPIIYQMSCPTSLFTSSSLYNSLCTISPTGQFSLSASSINSVGGITPYIFNIYIIMSGTSILQNYTLSLYVYLDGSSNSPCPGVSLTSSYIFNEFVSSSLTIIPSYYLYCSGYFYNILSANWTAVDSTTGVTYANVFSYGTQQYYTTAYLYQASTTQVLAGAVVNAFLNLTLQNVTSGSSITEEYETQISFSQSLLVPQVVAQNAKGATLTIANGVNFTEPSLVLNAQTSYDPDNSTATLAYSWTCPDAITQYYSCAALVSTNGQTLTLNQYQRVKSQLSFNTQYTFTLTVSSVDNPYKVSQTLSYSVSFNPPSKQDLQNGVNSTCDSMLAPYNQAGLFYYNQTYPKLVRYDLLNYTTVSYNVIVNDTSLVCSKGTVVEQRLVYYVFDAGFFTSTQVPTVLFAQDTSSPLVNSSTITVPLGSSYNMLSVTPSYYYQTNVYWYTVRQLTSGAQSVYLNVDTVYFSKVPAALVAQIANNVLTVDKYSDLYIDASSSYDPEGQNLNYTYKWTCPGKMTACASQTSSILKVTPIDRNVGSQNVNGVTYAYSVIMSDGVRNSAPATATVTITQQSSYASCLTQYTNTDNFNDNYQSSNNNTLYIQYNQSQTIPIIINATASCQYATVSSTSFTGSSKITFWVNDTTYTNVIYITNAQAIKNLKTSAMNTISILQYFIMGSDTTTPYNNSNYINVVMNPPDLNPQIKGNSIASITNQNSTAVVSLSSNSSSDSLKTTLTSYWTCPSYLGGSNCSLPSPSSTLSFNYTYLQTLAGGSLTPYYDMSHQFILTLVSSDNLRLSQKSYYVYFASPSQGYIGLTSSETCGISMTNDTGSQLKFSLMQTFSFSCPTTSATNNIISGQTLEWSIAGLTANTDYFQSTTQLYLKAYALQSLQGASLQEMVVSLTISPNMTGTMEKSYKIILPYLQTGSVSLSSVSSGSTVYAYSTSYQLNFNGFSSSQNSGLQFQLRAYSKIYDSNQIVFPIKPLSPFYTNTVFSSFSLPYASSLKVDFFDMNNNYIGSYEMFTNSFYTIAQGSYQQSDYETALYTITAKTASSYSNTTQGKLQFEIDIYSLKQLGESIANSIISVTDSTLYPSYRNSIIGYLISNFITPLSYFNSSSTTYDYQSRQVLERNVIYILNSVLLKTNSLTNAQVASLLTILDIITTDYALITADGDEQEVLRESLINIFEIMQSQLNTTSGTTTQYTKLTTIQTRVLGSDTKGLTAGTATSYFSSGSFRSVLLLQTNKSSANQSYNFVSQISSTEGVTISNQSYLSSLGINSLETTFQSSSNTSAPVSTIIYINAYDKSSSRLDISFNSSDPTYIDSGISVDLSFQATTDFISMFEDSSTYQPICSYYDTTANSWSSSGLTLASYDSDSGIITCTTSHFSQFSVDYITISQSSSSSSTGYMNNSNGTNNTNGTSTLVAGTYFQAHKGYYIAICVLTFCTVTFTVAFSFKFTRTKVDNRMPDVKSYKTNYSFCSIFCETALVHHSLISAYIGPAKGNIYLTMPQYNQVIFVHVYFFMTCLLVEFIMEHHTTYTWSRLKIFETDILIFVVFYAIKSVAYSANYYLFYRNYPLALKDDKKAQQTGSATEHQSLNEPSKISPNEQFEAQLEGGSDEDSPPKKRGPGVTSTRPHQSSAPHQQKHNNPTNQDNQPSVDDVDLDENDIQIEMQSEFAFKNNLRGGASGGVGNHQNVQSFTRDEDLGSPQLKNNTNDNTNIKSSRSKKKRAYLDEEEPEAKSQRNQDANSGRPINVVDMESNREFNEGKYQLVLFTLTIDGPQHIDKTDQKLKSSQVQHEEEDSPHVDNNDQQIISVPDDDNTPPKPKNKAMKTCGTVSKILFLYAKLVITLLFIYKLPSVIDIHHFVRSLYGVLGLYELFYEPIGFFIFTLMIKNAKNPMSIGCRIGATLLFGNPHPNMIWGVLYSLNNK